jgi:hypothetical protein
VQLLHRRPQQVPPPVSESGTGVVHRTVLAHLSRPNASLASASALDNMPLLPAKRTRWRSRAASTLVWMAAEASPRHSSDSFLSGF